MEDRLAEFRLIEKGKGSPIQIKNVTSNLMPEFSSKIKVLQQSINQIKSNNKEIITLKEQTLAATLNEQEKKLSISMNHYTELNKSLCIKVKSELEELQRDLNAEKIVHPNEPETRIKISSYTAFSNKFSEILKEFQNVQIEYKNAMKNKIARQARIIDSTLTDEQVLSLVNDPEGAQRLFAQQTLGKTHIKVQNSLSDIQDRYNDIRKIEQGVQAIHEMFLQMALLVQTQGATIDSIDHNLNQAQNYIKTANTKLMTAKRDHEKSQKWKWIIILAILIVGAIVLFLFIK